MKMLRAFCQYMLPCQRLWNRAALSKSDSSCVWSRIHSVDRLPPSNDAPTIEPGYFTPPLTHMYTGRTWGAYVDTISYRLYWRFCIVVYFTPLLKTLLKTRLAGIVNLGTHSHDKTIPISSGACLNGTPGHFKSNPVKPTNTSGPKNDPRCNRSSRR